MKCLKCGKHIWLWQKTPKTSCSTHYDCDMEARLKWEEYKSRKLDK